LNKLWIVHVEMILFSAVVDNTLDGMGAGDRGFQRRG